MVKINRVFLPANAKTQFPKYRRNSVFYDQSGFFFAFCTVGVQKCGKVPIAMHCRILIFGPNRSQQYIKSNIVSHSLGTWIHPYECRSCKRWSTKSKKKVKTQFSFSQNSIQIFPKLSLYFPKTQFRLSQN